MQSVMQDQPAEKPLSGQELIIVAVILAILSAILVPQYTRASAEEREDMPATLRQLRGTVTEFRRTHDNQLPSVFYNGTAILDGETAWREIASTPIVNPLNGRSDVCLVDKKTIDFGDGSSIDSPGFGNRAAPASVGWIVNTASHRLWATAANPSRMFNEGNPGSPGNRLK